MCYFDNATMVSRKKILIKDSIKAYKVLGYNSYFDSPFRSVYQKNRWEKNQLKVPKEDLSQMKSGNGRRTFGIYCFKSRFDAVAFARTEGFPLARGYVVVELEISGYVIDYQGSYYNLPGYQAERAKIVGVVNGIRNLTPSDKEKWVKKS